MPCLPMIESLEDRRLLSASPLTAKGVRVAAVEGQAFTQVSVATLKDKTPEAASAYAATIDWGDGNSSAGTVVADATGALVVDGSHTYAARGKYKTSIMVTETDGDTAHAASGANVADAAISVTGVNISGIGGLAIQGVVATYTDADPRSAGGPVAGQVASIRWGDRGISPGTLSLNAVTHRIEVTGKHTYQTAGSYTIMILIREPTVAPTSATATATIAAATPTLTPTLVGDFVGTAKAGGGLVNDIIGSAVGNQSFELNVTDQTIDGISGDISIAGSDVSGDLTGSLLNNRRFHYLLSGTAGTITISGRVAADGSAIAGNIVAKYSGASTLKFKGSFSANRQ